MSSTLYTVLADAQRLLAGASLIAGFSATRQLDSASLRLLGASCGFVSAKPDPT
jgi:hypothetical protein